MDLALSLWTYSQLAFEYCNIKSMGRVLPALRMRPHACTFLRSWETACMLSCFVVHAHTLRLADTLTDLALIPCCSHQIQGHGMDRDTLPPMGVVCIPVSSLIVPPLIGTQLSCLLDVRNIEELHCILRKDFLLSLSVHCNGYLPIGRKPTSPPPPTLPPLSFLATTFNRALDS